MTQRRPNGGWRRGSRIAATSALAAALLTGCQAIPDSGPVEAGLSSLRQADQPVLFVPNGPREGDSQADIVRNFVRAGSSNTDDYAIAREFLTPDYAEQWDPFAGVLVDEGTRPYRTTEDDVGVLSLSATASVSAGGVLTPIAPGPTTEVRFELEQVDGEWRISSAPTGIILDRDTFSAVWSAHQLYFLGADDVLVPETRWFLNRSTKATRIVNELIEGPAPSMRESLRTAFPAGTHLVSPSVPISEGTARIDLSSEMLEAGDEEQEDLLRQLSASLQAVSNVSRYELLADGASVASEFVGRSDEAPRGAEASGTAVMRDGAFGLLASGDIEPVPGLSEKIAGANPSAVVLDRSLTGAAVRNGEGTYWVTETESVLVDGRSGQLDPTVDPFGYVWTSPVGGTAQMLATLPGSGAQAVATPWLAGRDTAAIRISPDGNRIAALVSEQDLSAVLVAGIVRDEQGAPVATEDEAVVQLWTTGEPIDFDWMDEQRFAVLTSAGTGSRATIGGPGVFATEAGSVQGGAKISGDGNRSQLRVLSEDGTLFAPQGSGWQPQETGVDLLAKLD
ncbi:GerMN domain-containing protein [Leucobacter sp. CSA1]|uniref:GerMN domain-containing protein n=1 Tax=Leucobacter chromiisoli TaxID=2796471 RepID=A0A934Q518_9MICO|nr:LpqB family beta-propeller domain-containing protein [Leucobacter chromiisoli]MBK0417701.1 GerMN domain-containing protein [Leucobacter chromiisoli]